MAEKQYICDCVTCGSKFIFGPHRYNGKKLSRYGDAMVCHACFSVNHDGWSYFAEEKLLQHLEQKGLHAPERNQKWYLPQK